MLLRLDGQGPRYAQITKALRAHIQHGTLRPGARLPATRTLAVDLGCSRNIVLLAYEQLVLEGYLDTKEGAGTFVAQGLPGGPAIGKRAEGRGGQKRRRAPLSSRARLIVDGAARARAVTRDWRRAAIDFMYGVCEPDERVVGRAKRAFSRALEDRTFGYSDPAGDRELREQLAGRLRAARGLACSARAIVVTSGTQQALEICARLLVGAGDRVCVEDPGYEAAQAIFQVSGAAIVRVPVDTQGLNPAALPGRGLRPRLVYVTPSHQFPTGAVMPVARRFALLNWARTHRAYIVEDDYDGEFRYAGRRIEALAALEPDAPVVYCGTFAKSLFPSLRLGYLVLPPELVEAAVALKWLLDRGTSALLQRTVTTLMATGEYDRHIRRMWRRYRARRERLLAALERHLGSDARIEGGDAGLHVAAWLPALSSRQIDQLVDACRARGIGVYSIQRHASRPLRPGGLLLGYGIVGLDQIDPGIRGLAAAYREITN
jgi:GntR family transcriptional regulator / MocR family aminotransferase